MSSVVCGVSCVMYVWLCVCVSRGTRLQMPGVWTRGTRFLGNASVRHSEHRQKGAAGTFQDKRRTKNQNRCSGRLSNATSSSRHRPR